MRIGALIVRRGQAVAGFGNRYVERIEPRVVLASIVNGSFETPALMGGFTTLSPGNTTLPGWTISGASVAHVHDSTWKAKSGNRSLDLVGGATSAISQNLTGLTPNVAHRVTFWMTRNMYVGSTTAALKVIAGSKNQTFTFDTAGITTADPKWSQRTFDFTPGGSSVTLRFEKTANTMAGAIDDVKIAVLSGPEAEVRGNNVEILDNDSTPATSDHTDFGKTTVGTTLTRTFTVRNTGVSALTTSNLTVPSGFSIDPGDTLAASIPAGGQDTFKVRLSATSAGTFQGNVSFGNNDTNENPYNFAVKGVVDPATFALASNVLTVTGTSAADFIRGAIVNNVLTMRMNALTQTFNNASSITRIVINALGGNDLIVLSQSVNRPTSLFGGDGNDTITGGSGADTITGGGGSDTATKNAGDVLADGVEEVLA
jgi:choice-of-anchor C domain-containing protein